jgi:sulfatase modifying factor 1
MKYSPLLILTLISAFLSGCAWKTASNLPQNIETGIDPERWAYVSKGEFLFGQHEHEVMVDYPFEIMVTDVTLSQYVQYLNSVMEEGNIRFEEENPIGYYPGDEFRGFKHEEEILEGWYMLAAVNDPGSLVMLRNGSFVLNPSYSDHPVTLVTWFGAKAYCEYYGWRLPTEIEWEKAARGDRDNRPFPWGTDLARNNANYYSSHDIFEKLTGKGDTTPVGFYNGKTYGGYETLDSSSPYGLYDMAGNVWQWVGDIYEDQHYRYMRGGSKENYGYNLRVWTRNSASPTYFSPSVGFRCARDTE